MLLLFPYVSLIYKYRVAKDDLNNSKIMNHVNILFIKKMHTIKYISINLEISGGTLKLATNVKINTIKNNILILYNNDKKYNLRVLLFWQIHPTIKNINLETIPCTNSRKIAEILFFIKKNNNKIR